jgi:Domain of unknown function (DUF4062)/NB-ARC domain
MISSTGRDLSAYRQAAVEACGALGLAPVAMELFEAMGAGAAVGSKRKLATADVYVGIVAYRYGYTDPGDGRSVTEIEFDYAGELGLQRLCFLSDPDYPWPPEAIDADRARVEAFRRRVEREVIRATFTTVDDFRAKLIQALAGWRAPGGARPAGPDAAAAGPRSVSTVPPLAPLVIGRDEDLGNLKRRLGVGGERRPRTVVRGWPGVGKTTLLNALAHDADVAASFPDGLLWASAGQEPDPVAELGRWERSLAVAVQPPHDLADAMARMRALLAGRRALLIVDDVWETADAAPFLVGGPHCATLVTTRLPDVARALAPVPGDVYLLGQLDRERALALLAELAPAVAAGFPAEAARLVDDLEGLPLAIRVAARLLDAEAGYGWGISDLLAELTEGAGLLTSAAPEDRFDAATGVLPTLADLLRLSTGRLDPATRERFAFLGAMAPKPATFDLAAMAGIWLVEDARPTARTLVDRGLLEPQLGTGRFQLHSVLAMHARSLLDSEEA